MELARGVKWRTNGRDASSAGARHSSGERRLRQERAGAAEREQVRRLGRRQARLHACMEARVVAAELAVVPDVQQLLGEGAVVVAVHRGLVVLATRDEDAGCLELVDDTGQAAAHRDV